MCDPFIVGGIMVASAAMDFMGSKNQAKIDQRGIEQQRLMALQDNSEVSREIEDDSETERSELAIEYLKKRGQMRVAAGENMGMGLTTQLLMQDLYAQEGRESTGIDRDRSKRQRQNARQRESIIQNTQNQWNSIERPSLVGSGLQLAGNLAGSETFTSAFKSKPKTSAVSASSTPVGGGSTASNWA